MPSVAHQPIAHTVPVRQPTASAATTAREYDLLHADRIDFDAWLLPPIESRGGERVVRIVSQIAGPVAWLTAVALGLAAIF